MKNYFIALILILSTVSCKKSISDRVELICENGTEKITIEIENGQNFLVYDQPTKTNFVVTNIDPINLRISGAGITLLGTNKDKTTMRTEISVPLNYLDTDTLNIKVWYNDDDKKRCDFKIPMKKAE